MRKLVLLLAFMAPLAVAQASAPAVKTITVADLSSVVDLDGPWRFHPGDDPHFADPAFDDLSWPSVHPNQPFQAAGVDCAGTRIPKDITLSPSGSYNARDRMSSSRE